MKRARILLALLALFTQLGVATRPMVSAAPDARSVETLFSSIASHCGDVAPDSVPPAHRHIDCPVCMALHGVGLPVHGGGMTSEILLLTFLSHAVWPGAPPPLSRFERATGPRGPPVFI